MGRMGLDVDASHFYTSALATAKFISAQKPGGSAYVIGDPGLFLALSEAGITNNSVNPDYVIVGETNNYNYESICQAVHHVLNGAKLIGTNTDLTGPTEQGIVPACRALVSPIELATGKQAYFVGKPNPLMMRNGLKNTWCSFAGCGNYWRPYGYGYYCRCGNRVGYMSCSFWSDIQRTD